MNSSEGSGGWALALETSGAWGSVALGHGDTVHAVRKLATPRQYAREFVPVLQGLCAQANLDPRLIRLVFVSAGPGSFTGLRIGVTMARMLALAHGAKLVAVPTLEAVACNVLDGAPDVRHVAVVLDAKRGHVYASWFRREGEGLVAMSDAAEVEPFAFLSSLPADCAVIGEGVAYHREAIERTGRSVLADTLWPPRAELVYRLGMAKAARGEHVDRRDLVPVYIRPPDAEEKYAARMKK